jgi:tetratricopeptide (TPR) repeat protein
MNTFFKTLIIISLSFFFSASGFSQINTPEESNSAQTIDSLKVQIVKLEKLIEQNSYTRIPNKDFENIIDNRIQKSMRDMFNWWLLVIAAIVSVLGYFTKKYATNYLQSIVDSTVNQLKKEYEGKIESIISQHYSSVVVSLIDVKQETLENKQSITDELEILELKKHMTDESINLTENKKVNLIDTIMRCYYKSDFEHRIEKMITLIREYEGKFMLYSSTYYNAALAFGDMYNQYGLKDYLNSAIENCNKAIKIKPDYGLAYSQKLEIYVMAMLKAFDDTERLQYEEELLKVFKDIENNSSQILCPKLIERLEIDKNYFAGPYIEILYKEYADEMAKITARATPGQSQIETSDISMNS